MTEKIPEKWAVKLTKEAKEWIKNKFNTKCYETDNEQAYFNFPNYTDFKGFRPGHHSSIDMQTGYTEISIEQLKQLDNNNMKEKEIIGYKCIKAYPGVELGTKNLEKTSYQHAWYIKYSEYWEPVYKSSIVGIKMGNYFWLVIEDGKVFHKSEDITNYVTDMMEWGKSYLIPNRVTNCSSKYPTIIKEITFSKTGCENVETKLSEWINVYNELQKQK